MKNIVSFPLINSHYETHFVRLLFIIIEYHEYMELEIPIVVCAVSNIYGCAEG